MNRKRLFVRLSLVVGIVLVSGSVLAGCSLLNGLFGSTVSASDRAQQFVDDLSTGSGSQISADFADDVAVKGQIDSDTYWDGTPFTSSYGPFTWDKTGSSENVTPPNVSGVTSTEIDGTITGSTGSNSVAFYMVADSNGDFFIREFVYNSTGSSGGIDLYNIHSVK